MMSSAHGAKSFLAGAVCSAAAAAFIYSYQQFVKSKETLAATTAAATATSDHVTPSSAGSENRGNVPPPLMDSPLLSKRMIRKAEGAILNRTSRLIVCIERCTNDHNYSAILRTVEALGVQNVYIISPQTIKSTLSNGGEEGKEVGLRRSSGQAIKQATEAEVKDRANHHFFAQKATEWLTVTDYADTSSCINALKQQGYEIWATDLGQVATCLTKEELGVRSHLYGGKLLPERLAIVFGTEAVGCTNEMLNAADLRVYLPLRGFADSLNLSVATALVVHHLFMLDPTLVGAMSEEERRKLRCTWYAKLASQRLLSAKEKRYKSKLLSFLRSCDALEKKRMSGKPLYRQEEEKLDQMASKQAELDAINKRLSMESALAVKDLVDNPPAPITDMRRADEHRITYVGKNTKAAHRDAWADMPATAHGKSARNTSASFFRDRVVTAQPKE